MKPSRIALLMVAIAAGGMAAFLSTQRDPVISPAVAAPAPEIIREARAQVLVARAAILVGERLSPATVEWVDWPEANVRPEYITSSSAPDAMETMAGAMARFEFFPGEPIREGKLAGVGQGYLSAVLKSGMRGVSVSITAESASGGFIVPNDHVDVVLTSSSDDGVQNAETILRNVRVMAINTRLGESAASEEDSSPEMFSDQAIATLELDTMQAEVIIAGSTRGKLSLVLRSMDDFSEAQAAEGAANQAIRISSPFWQK